MKKIILTVILGITIIGLNAQQNNHNSVNHIKTGVNTNVSSFNNQNETIPFSYGISPYVTCLRNGLGCTIALGWQTYDDQWKTAPECTRYYHWNELNVSAFASYGITPKLNKVCISVFCGPSIDFLADYHVKIVSAYNTSCLNTNESAANDHFCGIGITVGTTVSFNLTDKISMDISPFFKYKILNEIRDDDYPRLPRIVHPNRFYGVSFSFCYQIK